MPSSLPPPRLPPLDPAALTPEQREIHDAIVTDRAAALKARSRSG